MKTAKQVSSGGVVARKTDRRWDVCLIARRRDDGELVWGLPKGHLEPGEGIEAAAVREIREETGLAGRLLRKLGAITYWFVAPASQGSARTAPPARADGPSIRYFKTVHFFLVLYQEGRTDDHDDEVEEARWVPLSNAVEHVSYDNERRILRKAAEYLEHQDASAA